MVRLVGKRFLRKQLRVFRRRPQLIPIISSISLLTIVAIGYASNMHNQSPTVDPASYTQMLNLIGRAESNDNYNAYFGNASNTEIKFTDMSIAEVMKWQADFVAQGHASSAVGRYQIINTTLSGLVNHLALDPNQKFDSIMQDRLAIALLERRGSVDYVTGQLTPQQFAANLAREWAALPRVIGGNDPNASYYAGDGLNASRTSVDEVMNAIEPISAQ